MTIIRIKRSSVTGNPNKLAAGELAYSALPDNGANGGDRLYIGIGSETNGNAANHYVIGGKFFTDRLSHSAGVLTTGSAVVVGADGKIDVFNVDNLTLDGNTLSSTNANGNIVLSPNGNGLVNIANAYSLPRVDGIDGYVLTTDGAGNVAWEASAATLNISADGATTSSIALLSQSLTIAGGTNVLTSATAQKITINVNTATNSLLGVAKFNSANFDVVDGNVSIKDGSITNTQLTSSTITINNTLVPLGGSATIGSDLNNTITFGTGLSASNLPNGVFSGSTATTVTVDATIATTSSSQTLTNKTIDANSNTISNLTNDNLSGSAGISNANLANSSITLGTTEISLGETTATISGLTQLVVGDITIDNGTVASTGNLNLNIGNTGTIIVNNARITGLASPTSSTDAATKSYVDGVAQGLDVKDSVRAATTANITLSGTQTVDGVSLEIGNRILVKNQSNPEENGIYIVDSDPWARSVDTNSWDEMVGAFTFVEEGDTLADTGWVCSADIGGTLDTDPLIWTQFSGAGTYLAGTGLSLQGNTFSISTTYAGQSSISTLGTVTQGTWNANTIATNYGGTGITTYNPYDILVGDNSSGLTKLAMGLAGQVLQVNTAGNALVYADVDGGEY